VIIGLGRDLRFTGGLLIVNCAKFDFFVSVSKQECSLLADVVLLLIFLPCFIILSICILLF